MTQADARQISGACPACGQPAECGMAKGEATCWCFELPRVVPMPAPASEARCYCSSCLQRMIDERAAGTAR
jgi:hypothetical protein